MRWLINIFVALCCFSCAPYLSSPDVDIPSEYIFGDMSSADSIDGYWWSIYNDEVLDSLERQALAQNKNLAVAASRVESARYSLSIARSAFLPSLDAELSAEGEYTTIEGRSYDIAIQPTVSWNVSLFGALKYTSREAQAELLSTEWAYRGVILSLTKEVATTYFTILQCRQSLDIARHSHQLRVESAALMDSLLLYGSSTMLDREQAMSLVYTAAADIEQYSRALTQAELSLATLLGESPQTIKGNNFYRELSVESLPKAIPAGVPSDILYRRPDIMESYYELQSAAAGVGIAHSNRFPTISLTGSGGMFGSTVKELFSDGHWKWGAMGNIVQPMFNFGNLRNRERLALKAYDQARLRYEQQILTALEEVESALLSIATYRTQAEKYAKYVIANGRIAELTKALYSVGMYNYMDVISTEQTWYQSQLQMVELVAQQYINYANLVMALGDGWQNIENNDK